LVVVRLIAIPISAFLIVLMFGPRMADDAALFFVLLFVAVIGLTAYFAPSLIANYRGKRNRWAIFALNLCLGWTGLGWVVALVWSLMQEAPQSA
jgi:hypothetical protein